MKTLDEFNFDRRRDWDDTIDLTKSHPNGIACSCGEELWDTYPNSTLTSNPPQKEVHCQKCGFQGFRVA